MTDLSAFDALFAASALPALYAQFGTDMTYTPPGGAGIEGVRVIRDEQDRTANAGEFGNILTKERFGRIQTADPALAAAGVRPRQGGILTLAGGERLKIDAAPRADNGEWVLDLVDAPA
jgi:hypothetical protein